MNKLLLPGEKAGMRGLQKKEETGAMLLQAIQCLSILNLSRPEGTGLRISI